MRYILLIASLVIFNALHAQWTWLEVPVNTSFHEVRFWEDGYGTVLGKGSVLRTCDGGVSWNITEVDILKDCISFSFPEPGTGYALLNGYEFLKTTDSGYTWNNYSIAKGNRAQVLNSLDMIDSDNGFVVGFWISPGGLYGPLSYRTSDGMNWNECCDGLSGTLERIKFQDALKGYAANRNGDLFLTKDGGDSWWEPDANTGMEIRDVYFVDDQIGYLAASSYSGGITERAIMKTIDGGNTWSVIHEDTVQGDSRSYRRIWFQDAMNGWIIGTWGLISRTYDGGLSWIDEDPGTNEFFYDCYFQDIDNGVVVGSKGSVLKLGDLSGIHKDLSMKGKELMVYPNPCNEMTLLTWHSNYPGRQTIELFNPDGKCMRSISHTFPGNGEYKVTLNTSDLPSGIYLVRTKNADATGACKLVVVH